MKKLWRKLKVYTVDEETQTYRISLCESCEHFTKTRQCYICFCFMDLKTQLAAQHCPIHKWPKIAENAIVYEEQKEDDKKLKD